MSVAYVFAGEKKMARALRDATQLGTLLFHDELPHLELKPCFKVVSAPCCCSDHVLGYTAMLSQ